MAAISNPFILTALSRTSAAAALVWSLGQGQLAARSTRWLSFAAVPGLVAIAAFYALAIHMHSSLGGWPDFYGTAQLPPDLAAHAEVTSQVFMAVVLLAFGMPLLLAFCALVPRLRAHMVYPAFCGVACWGCLFLTALAPAGFQRWWWD